jgi:hypothetical protein
MADTERMTDDQIAARLREIVGTLNHFTHVAHHRGLFVQLTAASDGVRAVSDVCVMRPILPVSTPDTGERT